MSNGQADSERDRKLRDQAESMQAERTGDIPDMSLDEVRKLVHELETHQIELKLQNEQLRSTQEELLESRDRYANLYDFAPIGYMTTNHMGLILEANLTLADMLGVPRNGLVNHPFSAFIVPDDQDIYYLHRQKILDSMQRSSCQLRILKKDDDPFFASMDSIPIDTDDDNDTLIRTIVIDVTERHRAEDQLADNHKKLEHRNAELKWLVDAMTDRELRMIELKDTIRLLRTQIEDAGMTPLADDPLRK